MANLTISNLSPAGSDLFQGEDSFLQELSEQEMSELLGGAKVTFLWSVLVIEW